MNDCITIDGVILAMTEKAIMLDLDDRQPWLPKSQIEITGTCEIGEEVSVDVPNWLCERCGIS